MPVSIQPVGRIRPQRWQPLRDAGTRRVIICVLTVFSLPTFTNVATQHPVCTEEQGWFVRVCAEKIGAEGIDLWVGSGGNDTTHRYWRRWRPSEPAEFIFPIEFLHQREIWFKAQTATDGKNVYLGFGFNGRIIKHLDMDDIGKPEEYEKSWDDDGDEFDCP
jgi:hypothetical protein